MNLYILRASFFKVAHIHQMKRKRGHQILRPPGVNMSLSLLSWYEPTNEQWCTHTLTGSPWHLKLVHETPELLSYSHGPQQTLIIEEVFLTPLGALLVLQERGKAFIVLIRVNFFPDFCQVCKCCVLCHRLSCMLHIHTVPLWMLHTHSALWGGLPQPLQISCALGPAGWDSKNGLIVMLTEHFCQTHNTLLLKACFHLRQLSSDWAAQQTHSESASLLQWWQSLWSSQNFLTRGASWQTWGWEETPPSARPRDQSNGRNGPDLPTDTQLVRILHHVQGHLSLWMLADTEFWALVLQLKDSFPFYFSSLLTALFLTSQSVEQLQSLNHGLSWRWLQHPKKKKCIIPPTIIIFYSE